MRDRTTDLPFPVTIRPIDTHAGEGLEKLDAAGQLSAYYTAHPESEFYLAEYIDYRSRDGLFRKYRIALIDGKPFLCHLAISDHWIVHYVSASMSSSREKRNEESAAMESFDHDFASRHADALQAIARRLDLDYVVLDCGEMPDGRLLFFEADVAGWIHAIDATGPFSYKLDNMQKAFSAFRQLLVRKMA